MADKNTGVFSLNRQQLMFVETQGQGMNSLQASLFDTHADWQILFIADASAVLDLISRRKAGIVLANSGMDNAGCEEFFRRVRKTVPEVIRSGLLPDQATRNIAKALEYIHECIAAHYDMSQMEMLIARSLAHEKTRKSRGPAALLSNFHTTPTPPAIYFEIRDEPESTGVTANSVAESMLQDHTLQQDTALTATQEQDNPSMFDGPLQRKPLMDKLVEQCLIQPRPHDPVENLTN
jgi:hypothetical protein